MTRGEFGIGMTTTGMTFFFGAGIANNFMPVLPSLAIGLVVWAAVGYAFVRGMKGGR